MTAQDKRYAVKCRDLLDVKMCNCACCGLELLGLADRDQAHLLHLQVATYVLDRPYCKQCGLAEGAKQQTCLHCGERPFLRDMRAERRFVTVAGELIETVKHYCLWCSICAPSAKKPRSLAERDDAHARTTPPGMHNLINYDGREAA